MRWRLTLSLFSHWMHQQQMRSCHMDRVMMQRFWKMGVW